MTHSTEWLPSAWVNYPGYIQDQEVSLEPKRTLEDKVHFGIFYCKMTGEIPEWGQTSLNMTKEVNIWILFLPPPSSPPSCSQGQGTAAPAPTKGRRGGAKGTSVLQGSDRSARKCLPWRSLKQISSVLFVSFGQSPLWRRCVTTLCFGPAFCINIWWLVERRPRRGRGMLGYFKVLTPSSGPTWKARVHAAPVFRATSFTPKPCDKNNRPFNHSIWEAAKLSESTEYNVRLSEFCLPLNHQSAKAYLLGQVS